ncbi:MAG: adenylate/guanylate cyclase domain-containing protein [Burkholderiales bacterium]
MHDSQSARVAAAALALSAFSLAVVGAWAWAGAPVPSAGRVSATSPFAGLLLVLVREGSTTFAAAIVWLLVMDVVLAVGLVVLLVARAQRSPQASWLGFAIASLAAGFATLFFALSLAPFDAWVASLGAGVSKAIGVAGSVLGTAALCGLGVALLALGMGTLFRFWMSYPQAAESGSVGAFARARLHRLFPRENIAASWFVKRPSRFALDAAERHFALWFGGSALRGPLDGAVGRWFLKWSVAAVVVWSAVSFLLSWMVASPARGAQHLVPAVAIAGLMPLLYVVNTSMYRIADVVAYQYEFASARDHRRIEWLHAAGVFARFAIGNMWLLVFPAAVAWMAFETFVLQRNDSRLQSTHYVFVIVFPLAVLPAVYVAGLGASVLARGLVDPRLALRRITLWTLLGVLVTLIFLLVERAVALQLVRWLALPADTGAVVAGAAIAMTFVPMRRAIQGWVDRYVERRMPVEALAEGERHTGAVAIVDISGFTALTTRDESGALLATTLLQREAKRLAEAHEGRFVKSTGDGVMLAFPRASAAIFAVRDLYREFERMRESLSLPPVLLHTGIHWGEYVDVRGTDIYGHTVNLASRLADAAGPGEIVASADYAAALGPVEPAPLPLGARRFKNVADPVECVRM